MDESDANPPSEEEQHTTAVHTCSYSLASAASSYLRACALLLYHTILSPLHGVRGADMLRKARCEDDRTMRLRLARVHITSQGFPAGVDRPDRKTVTLELKPGSFEPLAE
ncbi:hypothetical protein PAAG_11944 [Paracoccidioides lutzii Pb01]|uniref:Uncharacterized protein n=1 Tax=Paracoccidioides lutzii (strain ATCC MYA-826 / Pb01) TaxID=502779 RepID=A0A0A2V0N1_PARBA|nr:hypothetical protein PAAG_11944 [Paracoccidioides lutzii Pb01]KGQ01366.1 hypothetical protein PAAG_11944 [Paracoccidioides lutzii Pb01]